ncbi:uncharacterized protein LOC106715745 [Papilio machaon]|uniref:uncharacterized protein LOC106715745 n=1 Tax=Papilio machaon TaxID=76193 RepID=UPI001E664742|nr:uncharacterized protein LOC106715745 [Papilio machaon]
MKCIFYIVIRSITLIVCLSSLYGLNFPNCSSVEFFEASSFNCRPCPYNGSMVASVDGLSCICENHSIVTVSGRCRACNVTEVVSADGSSCVPRRCQASAGRVVCRRCPKDYIAMTQNYDGSPMKVVQCVKCARGYRPLGDTCVKCHGCDCKRLEVLVHGTCLPKKYVTERPKYEENLLHPSYLLDIVKYEYLCVIYNISACRWLANACVSNFYSSDPAGACRLWIYPNLISHNILPTLSANKSESDRGKNEIHLSNRQNTLLISSISYKNDGSFKQHLDPRKRIVPCLPPFMITIGEDYSLDCPINISEVFTLYNEIHALYVSSDKTRKPISILIRKPNGQYVKKGLWYSSKFSKYFVFRRSLSATSNVTNLIYLREFLIRLRIVRDQNSVGALKVNLNVEAHYAIKSPASDIFMMSLRVNNDLPSAGVIRGLEIWGSILCFLMVAYAFLQWRGVLRRGGLKVSLLPIMAGCISDAIYFATWTTLVHALAAEAGTLGLTLPLAQSEEQVTAAMIYTILTLKVIKVAYTNWKLSRYDIFFIDWSEYNPSFKDTLLYDQSNEKKQGILAREWIEMHTKRRTSPAVTVILTILTLNLLLPWQLIMPNSEGYKWAIATIAWWSSYILVFLTQMVADRLVGSPPIKLQRICTGLEISMLVFQEELYAHYVHGRNDESSDTRYLSGPLTTCRVSCAPQFRILLSKFLAAFFERALDGLSWVASERTVLEKLLDLEITTREGGNTSILLYETDNLTPSCFSITWWGNEWTLATFDSIVFSCVLFSTNKPLYAAFVTVALWQIMKYTITWLAIRNVKEKTKVRGI